MKDVCPLVLFRSVEVCVPVTVPEDVWTYCVLIAVMDMQCLGSNFQDPVYNDFTCTVFGLGYISVFGQIPISWPVSLSQSWTVFLDSACFTFSDQVFRDFTGGSYRSFFYSVRTGQIRKSSPVSWLLFGIWFSYMCPGQRPGMSLMS